MMVQGKEQKRNYYFTTPIYYVNAKPHIGHAYTTILCDTFARFHRFMGETTYFLTGTDEHGEKIEKTAKEAGMEPLAYVDTIVPRFKELWETLDIRYDDFIRTTEERHTNVVRQVLSLLHDKGDIYPGMYRGWYCTPCESFFTEKQLENGKCPDCKREVREIEEENYFFKMSAYQTWLIDYIKTHEGFIRPRSKENEVLSFLQEPLEDLCISRPRSRLGWGIPLPFNEEHVLYVWFDALINYISAIGYTTDEKKFATYWPATIHFMAKDILRQHAIYWPIMLKALGIVLPHCVLAHGYWTMEGTKMSKSRGNVADPTAVIETYGRDTLRYFLLKEVTLGLDGGYADDYVASRFNTDLANDLGNLVHRSFSMLEKYRAGVVPERPDDAGKYRAIVAKATALADTVNEEMDTNLAPRNALIAIWELIGMANKLVEETKPWTLAKDPARAADLDGFLYVLFETLRFVAVIIVPFLPDTARMMLTLLKQDTNPSVAAVREWGKLVSGTVLEKGRPLFPKVET